jgi:hypothetical protein
VAKLYRSVQDSRHSGGISQGPSRAWPSPTLTRHDFDRDEQNSRDREPTGRGPLSLSGCSVSTRKGEDDVDFAKAVPDLTIILNHLGGLTRGQSPFFAAS